MNKRFKQVILLLGDLLILYLTLFLSLMLRFPNRDLGLTWRTNEPYFVPVFVIWLIVLYIIGAYKLDLAYNQRRFRLNVINSTVFAATLSIVYFYLSESDISPKTILAIFVVVFGILFFLWRSLFNFFVKSYLPKNNLAFIGWNKAV